MLHGHPFAVRAAGDWDQVEGSHACATAEVGFSMRTVITCLALLFEFLRVGCWRLFHGVI